MSSAVIDEKKADEARSALVSDIQELKNAGLQIAQQANAKLPWIIGGAVGLLAIATVIALKPKRRSFALLAPPQRSLLGKAARAAALSAIGILARRLATQAVDKTLPEQGTAAPSAAET